MPFGSNVGLCHLLSTSACSDKHVLVVGMVVHDKVSGRGVVVPAKSDLLEPPWYEFGQDIFQPSKKSRNPVSRDEVGAGGYSRTGRS